MQIFSSVFAYVGPDTFLPVTSVLSALVGVVMMFWGTGQRWFARGILARLRRGTPPAPKGLRFKRNGRPMSADRAESKPRSVRD